jgi:hypothetical protein
MYWERSIIRKRQCASTFIYLVLTAPTPHGVVLSIDTRPTYVPVFKLLKEDSRATIFLQVSNGRRHICQRHGETVPFCPRAERHGERDVIGVSFFATDSTPGDKDSAVDCTTAQAGYTKATVAKKRRKYPSRFLIGERQ